MKHRLAVALMIAATLVPVSEMQAARVVRVRTRPARVRVTVRPGFPIRRTLPAVVVRPGPVIRVAPRAYLAPVVFGAVVVATLPPPAAREWTAAEDLDREDGWTDFTMDVDRRGTALLLDVDRGAAQVSFAEVVFENGEAQVVDFNDHSVKRGVYSLLDFRDGRKVDHVHVVAKADTADATIRLHLLK